MRSRRKFLATSSAVTGLLAGCVGALEDGEKEDNQPPGPDGLPSYEQPTATIFVWAAGLEGYEVEVSADPRGADKIVVYLDGNQIYSTLQRETGTTIEYGAEEGQEVEAVAIYPDGERETIQSRCINCGGGETDQGDQGDDGQRDSTDDGSDGSENQDRQEQPPDHFLGLSGDTSPADSIGGATDREFQYEIGSSRYTMEIGVPDAYIDYYESRSRTNEYGAYVADPYDDQYIGGISNELRSGTDSDGEALAHALSFVQQLEYTTDEVSAGIDQYPRYPVETLYDSGGDCEDSSILLANILQDWGYETVLLAFWDDQHMAVGAAGEEGIEGTYFEESGTRYYYLESTAPGWGFGEIPDDLSDSSAELIHLDDYPVLVFDWSTSEGSDGSVQVDAEVSNVGTTTARNVQFFTQFLNRSDSVRAINRSSEKTIAPNRSESFSIPVNPPENTELKAETGVLIGGDVHDIDESDWIQPS